jgi:hypothetical protein
MGIGDGPGGLGAWTPDSESGKSGTGTGPAGPGIQQIGSSPGPSAPGKSGTTGSRGLGCPARHVTVSWDEWTQTSESLTSASGVINEIE